MSSVLRGGLLGLVAFLFLLAVRPVAAQGTDGEYISSFASDITVGSDGTITVHETIAIRSAGVRLIHGIVRDFPTDYRDGSGSLVRVPFEVVRVLRDGNPEQHDVQILPGGRRVKIGSPGVRLMNGFHVYEIVYLTRSQIGFFPDHDELQWNVTNNWVFPIERATARVHLPPGARILQHAFYTGVKGSRDQDAEATQVNDRNIWISTTDPLEPGEGLTIAVGFTKGIVRPPRPEPAEDQPQ